MEFSIIIKTI